jgi:O-antigen ligase
MSSGIAIATCAAFVALLIAWDRERGLRTSWGLWVPTIWLLIAGSRMVSLWFEGEPAQGVSPDDLLDGSPLDRNVLLSLIVAGVVVLWFRRGKLGGVVSRNRWVFLFFAYCALSTLWSDFFFVAVKRYVKFIGDLVMVLVVVTEDDPAYALRRLLANVGFVLLPASILVIKYFPLFGRGYQNYTWLPVVTGVTTGKNQLGMICLIFGVAAVWRLSAGSNRGRFRSTLAQMILLSIALWLFVEADSMTSLSCFAISSALLVATAIRPVARARWLVHLLVVFAIVTAFSTLFLGVGGDVLEAMGRDSTLTGRTGVWDLVLTLAGNPLIGTGFDSFWLGPRLEEMWRAYWWHPNEAHNGYLEVFLNLGWIGVFLLVAVIVAAYRNVIGLLGRDVESGRIRLAYLTMAIAYNFTEAALKTFNPVWLCFLIAAVVVPPPAERPRHDLRVPVVPGANPWLLAR